MAHNATTLPVETAVIWSDDEEAPDAVVAARAAAAAQRAEARRRAAATPEAASNGRTYSTGNRCFVLSSNVTTARATEEKVSGPESARTDVSC